MGQIVKAVSARVTYENGDRLHVTRTSDGRFAWSLFRRDDTGPGDWHEIAENDDAAGVWAAMVGAAVMHAQTEDA